MPIRVCFDRDNTTKGGGFCAASSSGAKTLGLPCGGDE